MKFFIIALIVLVLIVIADKLIIKDQDVMDMGLNEVQSSTPGSSEAEIDSDWTEEE